MTSFLIISSDKAKRQAYVQNYSKQLGIDAFDITIIEKETSVKQNTQSISIEDVKLMQKKIFLKPLKSKTKAVILEDSHLLTPEAQNALIKVLEEPPAHTIIMLGADTKEALLPTILSRCQIVMLEEEKIILTPTETAEYTDFLSSLTELTVGDRLKKAEQLAKEKDKAIVWIGNVLIVLRGKALKKVNLGSNVDREVKLLNAFQELYTQLKTTNVNPRFAIENTLLSF